MITVILSLISTVMYMFMIISLILVSWVTVFPPKGQAIKGLMLASAFAALGTWVVQLVLLLSLPAL
jgi:hypothetical protein